MTESLYVPGQLANTERVLVDIGTGYFLEKVWGPGGEGGDAGTYTPSFPMSERGGGQGGSHAAARQAHRHHQADAGGAAGKVRDTAR